MRKLRTRNRLGLNIEQWRLIDLGYADPYIAQTFYESIAETVENGLSPNTLILVIPSSAYACIGYHQDLEKEIDLQYTQKKKLPIIRRSQGGGATYLDSNQLFYQIISKQSQVIPTNIDKLFEKLLSVTVETYRSLGLSADFKPLNDVVVNNKKISGNGASTSESTTILVGNIILDLDYEQMARVLRVPDEKFRDKIAKSMIDWVTSLKRELNQVPSINYIKMKYLEQFQNILGIKLVKLEPLEAEWKIFKEKTLPRNLSHEWLYMEAPYSSKTGRSIKIAHEIKVSEVDYKTIKMLRIRAELKQNQILNIQIRGDFFANPKESIKNLEETLAGTIINELNIKKIINEFFNSHKVDIPGISNEDIVNAILKLVNT
ncbi:hypothetical protein FJY84_00315 [Candidatus Bathyarchaeota archaeon]|nr:hypothetical protein [Candidatus Bathyarchaeota archaeon]